MNAISCPYSLLDLKLALFSGNNKLEKLVAEMGEEELVKLMDELVLRHENKDENEVMAKNLGISVLDLINSPNYETLKTEYMNKVVIDLIDDLEKTFGFTIKEGWAFVLKDRVEATDLP